MADPYRTPAPPRSQREEDESMPEMVVHAQVLGPSRPHRRLGEAQGARAGATPWEALGLASSVSGHGLLDIRDLFRAAQGAAQERSHPFTAMSSASNTSSSS